VRKATLFEPDGKPTGILLRQWRRRDPAKPLQARIALADRGAPTAYFTRLWRDAFPDRRPLPDRIADKDGRGTDEFWDVFGA
jgi:hypothetical protein